jgi:hypothetical protein
MFIVKNTSNDSNLLEKILLFLEVNTSFDFHAGYLQHSIFSNVYVIPPIVGKTSWWKGKPAGRARRDSHFCAYL